MLIGGGVTKKKTENGKNNDWERRKEKNRTGRKLEGDGTKPRTGHCSLSSGKKNEDSGKKARE